MISQYNLQSLLVLIYISLVCNGQEMGNGCVKVARTFSIGSVVDTSWKDVTPLEFT